MPIAIALAFAGGYADAGSFITTGAFTGHVTGNLVLAAVALARRDWHGALLKAIAVGLFLAATYAGFRLSSAVKRTAHALVIALLFEILLVALAPALLLTHRPHGTELIVICLCSALGLQNGTFSKADGVSVHTTYLTGDLTKLMEALANRSKTLDADQTAANRRTIGVIALIWTVFIAGAVLGALGAIRIGPAALWLLEIPLVITVALARHGASEQSVSKQNS